MGQEGCQVGQNCLGSKQAAVLSAWASWRQVPRLFLFNISEAPSATGAPASTQVQASALLTQITLSPGPPTSHLATVCSDLPTVKGDSV